MHDRIHEPYRWGLIQGGHRVRDAAMAEHFDCGRRTGFLHRFALVIDHGAHAAPFGAGDNDIALLQRTLLHQHGRDRTTPAVELAFNHGAFSRAVWIGAQIKDFRLINVLLTADDDELTPTMKLKRSFVETKHGELISQMY